MDSEVELAHRRYVNILWSYLKLVVWSIVAARDFADTQWLASAHVAWTTALPDVGVSG